MKSIIRKILVIIISFLFLIFLNSKVNAASAEIECAGEVEVNKPINISVKGSGVQWKLKLLVDGKVIATSSELDNFESNKTISFAKEYTPTTVGDKEITIEGSVTEFSDGSTVTKFKSKNLKVNAKKEENTNTSGNTGNTNSETKKPDPEPKKGTVTECRINGVKVNQYLDVKNKDRVPVKVTTSTKEGLKIYNDKTKMTYDAKSGQTVNVQVVEGEQTLTITLDTGYKTTRRIISTKEGEETPPNVIEEPIEEEKVILKSLTVKGIKLVTEENDEEEKIDLILTPEFSSEVFEYTLDIPEEQNDIIKLDIEAIGDKENFTIEITGNENLVDGENVITILVKSKDGEKTAEYKIRVNKVAKVVEAVTEPVLDETPNTGVEDNFKDNMKLVIGGFIVLIAVIAIVFVLIKFRKKEDDEEIEQFNNVELENDEVKPQEDNPEYVSSEDNNHSKGIDFTSILKNKIEEKNEISNRKRMEKERNEELENREETFEVLKEENTISKKRGKHF